MFAFQQYIYIILKIYHIIIHFNPCRANNFNNLSANDLSTTIYKGLDIQL